MVRQTLKILQQNAARIFKLCLTVLRRYALKAYRNKPVKSSHKFQYFNDKMEVFLLA